MATTHECPRPGCTKQLDAGVFACGPHWFELPQSIRGRISQAWWSVQRGTEGSVERHEAAMHEAVQWWRTQFAAQGQLVAGMGLKVKDGDE